MVEVGAGASFLRAVCARDDGEARRMRHHVASGEVQTADAWEPPTEELGLLFGSVRTDL